MNVIKLAASTIGAVCVPIWFIDQIGSIGFVEGTSMEVSTRFKQESCFILANLERQGYYLAAKMVF